MAAHPTSLAHARIGDADVLAPTGGDDVPVDVGGVDARLLDGWVDRATAERFAATWAALAHAAPSLERRLAAEDAARQWLVAARAATDARPTGHEPGRAGPAAPTQHAAPASAAAVAATLSRADAGAPTATATIPLDEVSADARPASPSTAAQADEAAPAVAARSRSRQDALATAMLFLLLGVCWGSSFAWIKVGLGGMSPAMLIFTQSVIGAAIVWTFVATGSREGRHRAPGLRVPVSTYVLVGALTCFPYLLIAWGEQVIDSGVAALITSTEPLWTLCLLRLFTRQSDGGRMRWAGVTVGFAGVVLLLVSQHAVTWELRAAGFAAVFVAAVLFATLGIFVSERLTHVPPLRVAAWSLTWSVVLLAPLAAMSAPRAMPPIDSIAGVLMLGVLDSALGYYLFYRLVSEVGPSRAAQVNYLLPVVAVVWGGLLLGEQVAVLSLGAMTLILVGLWLGTTERRWRWRRRRAASEASAPQLTA